MVVRRSSLPDIGAYGLRAGRTATLVLRGCYAKFNSTRNGLAQARIAHLGLARGVESAAPQKG